MPVLKKQQKQQVEFLKIVITVAGALFWCKEKTHCFVLVQ